MSIPNWSALFLLVTNTNDVLDITFDFDNPNWLQEWNFALLRTKGLKDVSKA